MKIYTRTGDDGTTGLIGGARIRKDDTRIDAYGTVDELNAVLGLAVTIAEANGGGEIAPLLLKVQNELFAMGSHLAVMPGSVHEKNLPPMDERWITRLEGEIDAAEVKLAPLSQFILPGGTELAGRLHLARTVARRAERGVIGLEQVSQGVLIVTYLNRLSDWLFVYARLANKLGGMGDVVWVK